MSSDYTIVDVTADGPDRFRPARAALFALIRQWEAEHGLDCGDIEVDTDADNSVVLTFGALTTDSEGEFVAKTREYVVTARYTVEVAVTVEASSEDEAREQAESDLTYASFDIQWVDDAEVTDVEYDGITDIDEQ